MSLARSALIAASRNQWLAEQFRRRAFAKRAIRRFMPGEHQEDALGAAKALAAEGIGTLLGRLGERVTQREEVIATRDHYLALFDTIRDRALPAHITVKLTQLGLDLDRAGCEAHVLALAERAAATGSLLWIDIEESHYVDATLDIFRRAKARHPNVGLALQAYLHRTPADLASLLPLAPAIRLVKGAYREPPEVAIPRKADVDAAYLALGRTMLDAAAKGQGLPVFGTHDLALVEQLRAHAAALELAPRAWEVHMLYGIRSAELRALAKQGVPTKMLVSYGSHWFPWYMRRLAERPANVWFVLRSMVS
jgi:proline dehydrogenase